MMKSHDDAAFLDIFTEYGSEAWATVGIGYNGSLWQ